MRLIGINGFKTAGKDTTYDIISELQALRVGATDSLNAGAPLYRVERRGFADNLKIMAAQALGLEGSDDDLIDAMNELKEAGFLSYTLNDNHGPITIDGRAYLQNFGQRAREVFWDTFWIDQVIPTDKHEFDRIWSTLGRPTSNSSEFGLPAIGCITDVRYPNEAERVLELGGEVWEVVRPGLESDGHSSEIPLPRDLVTVQVVNKGTLDDLRAKVAVRL